ncbi:GntR family transcriptional regulator [Subtercola frigoramans]|uniref:GntR family transcriptional regulator n=1 Tax=Subtercola frigoramans TaxID=120298 RepID=A0ABS2L206_9MICO|nr:GntR family transcriptional regulator [Subtercola frigoramans]MBM7471113.1 GntR family transcriptional regulator [Subtercola frigoramans]
MTMRNSPESLDQRLMQLWRQAALKAEPLPSQAALSELLGASRPSVREALVRLEQRGLVSSHAGSGTFPNPAALGQSMRLNESYEFSEMLREAGLEPTVEIIESGWTTLTGADAALLQEKAGGPAFRTVKRWLVDGAPIMVAVDVVPGSSRADLDVDPKLSVFEIVELLRGTRIEWEMTTVRARTADAHDKKYLGLARSEPVLGLRMVGVNLRGTPLYVARETHLQSVVEYSIIRSVPQRP